MGEINVTPFVDVMLVLLIVFMVTAPLLTVGVEVDLPKTQAGQINADAAPLVVSIKADGSLYLQETEMDPEQLIPRLKAISGANPSVRVFVRGDSSVAYGDVLAVMGRIQSAGFERVALVARLPEQG
jgi:biopolymer transport protein TolR